MLSIPCFDFLYLHNSSIHKSFITCATTDIYYILPDSIEYEWADPLRDAWIRRQDIFYTSLKIQDLAEFHLMSLGGWGSYESVDH